ncbi:MAG TPA: Lrp/AsnC family transcriptional regulator [Rhodospirillales bacterium]|nr:Lrp/AsnC family transcriptional regulator [Rhodospirillales bacterium]
MEDALDHKDSKKVKLDQIDHRILHDLQADGRITNVKLAENAGISAPPCLRRVRALEEDGYILGYHAEIDPARLDFQEMFFALVGLSSQAQTVLQGFEERVAQWPEVRECHMIRGGGDFLLKIVARDKEQRDALTMKLTSAENVIKVTTLETIRTSKNQPGVPVDISREEPGGDE